MVNNVNLNAFQPTQLPQLKAEGEMNGRTVKVENGDTKSAGLVRKAISSLGSFLAASAKFVFKATLFLTGITPLIMLTNFFWNCIHRKNESKEENQLPLVTSDTLIKSPVSDKDNVSEPTASGFREETQALMTKMDQISDAEENNVSEPTASGLHEEIQVLMNKIEQNSKPSAQKTSNKVNKDNPTVGSSSTESPRRSARTNIGVPPNRYGFS